MTDTEPQGRPTRAPTGLGGDPRPGSGARHEQVVLLAPDGTAIGAAPKSAVHGLDTPLHLAFSCYLFDDRGRVLLTRRALGKATWPGVWSNTCCGHPAPGEDPRDAVQRRLREELGIEAQNLREALPDFAYRAVDASGMVENEICPVWVGRAPRQADLAPDPHEVMDTAWVAWTDLVGAARTMAPLLSPWSVLQVEKLASLEVGLEQA